MLSSTLSVGLFTEIRNWSNRSILHKVVSKMERLSQTGAVPDPREGAPRCDFIKISNLVSGGGWGWGVPRACPERAPRLANVMSLKDPCRSPKQASSPLGAFLYTRTPKYRPIESPVLHLLQNLDQSVASPRYNPVFFWLAASAQFSPDASRGSSSSRNDNSSALNLYRVFLAFDL